MSIYQELKNLLEQPGLTERQVHALLKSHLDLIIGSFATSWNYAKAFSEVEFGSEFRADFVVLCANSGYWTAHVVELKSPLANLYDKKGDKSADLRRVERQIAQRAEWRRQNEQRFREVLANLVSDEDPAFCSSASVHVAARSELLDPRTVVYIEGHIVIGRSSKLTPEQRALRRQNEYTKGQWGSPELLTYDRILQRAKANEVR